jgi:hypothetical protein
MRRLALLMILYLAASMSSIAFGDYDIRNTFGAEGSIQTAKLAFEQELQFDDDGHHYHHADITLSHKVVKWLSLGAGYRQIYELKEEEWKLEKRPGLIASLSHKLGGFSISDKNKLEIRIREGKDTAWRYRSKLSLTPPLKVTDLKISPYLVDEIFIDEDGLSRNRLSAGVKLSPMGQLECELFGMIQSDSKDDEWANTSVLGTKVKAKF